MTPATGGGVETGEDGTILPGNKTETGGSIMIGPTATVRKPNGSKKLPKLRCTPKGGALAG